MTTIKATDLQLGDHLIKNHREYLVVDIQGDYAGNLDVKLLDSRGNSTFTVLNDLADINPY
jgi:hypothetical protein